jgi:hypothetical protein
MITKEMIQAVADGKFEISKSIERHISRQEFSKIVLSGGSVSCLIDKITENKRAKYKEALCANDQSSALSLR